MNQLPRIGGNPQGGPTDADMVKGNNLLTLANFCQSSAVCHSGADDKQSAIRMFKKAALYFDQAIMLFEKHLK